MWDLLPSPTELLEGGGLVLVLTSETGGIFPSDEFEIWFNATRGLINTISVDLPVGHP